MVAQQPLVTPTHRLARVVRLQNKQFNYVNHELLTTSYQNLLIKECKQFTKELTEQNSKHLTKHERPNHFALTRNCFHG